MRCRTAKWSPLNSLLVVAAILFSTSAAAFVDPKNSDSENQSSSKNEFSQFKPTNDADVLKNQFLTFSKGNRIIQIQHLPWYQIQQTRYD